MDAYSVCTSAAGRETSRIWQDLTRCGFHSLVGSKHTQMMSTLGQRRQNGVNRKPHVGIVGAGLAGLKCAHVLLEHGFEVTILEGRNRIGGRVSQEKLWNGHLVDCGPNWIHGTNDNPILDIAKETGTALGGWDTNSYVYDEQGKLVASADGEAYSTTMWNIVQSAFEHSNKHSASISPTESLWDYFQAEVIRRIPESKPDYEKERKLVLQLAEMWGAFVGSPIYRQSLKFFWLEECIEGENVFCAGTYQKILESIAKPALDGAHLRYLTQVTEIKTTTEDGDKLTVLTSGGDLLDFDEVVVTAPLGWLKQHPEAFNPALPPGITKAIQSIGYGCLEKVYISFPQPFWLKPELRGRNVHGFCQWLAPTYAPESNARKWAQEVVELASLAAPNNHPTLLFYIYGDQSRYITHEVAKLPSSEKKAAFLYGFFRPYYSRLPGYDETSLGCQPVSCLSTSWLLDDLAGNGSYANFQVGLEEGDADISIMREGLPERGLWLAGEHTAPFVALGTATGAYWSGQSVGRRIAEAYGREGGERTP